MYMGDYDETFPFVLDFSANCNWDVTNMSDNGKGPVVPGATGREPRFQLVKEVAPYVRNEAVWYCPSVGTEAGWDQEVASGGWKKGLKMRDQGTSYGYIWAAWPFPYTARWPTVFTFMGGKSEARVLEPSRWPMLCDEPDGFNYVGSLTDLPASVAPHFGGLNIAYGDGHVKYHHLEAGDGNHYLFAHVGDGIYPGQ
jgi:prepilin-type processing-associated H-X9-DG protein